MTGYSVAPFTSVDAEKSRKALAYKELRRAIVVCALKPGQRVSEAELQAASGQPRTPAREAALILIGQGLLEVIPRRGYVVTDISVESAMQLFDLYDLLSRQAIADNPGSFLPKPLALLRQTIESPPQGGPEERRAALIDLSDALRAAIMAGTQNPWLRQAYDLVNVHMQRLWSFAFVNEIDDNVTYGYVPILRILEAPPEERVRALEVASPKLWVRERVITALAARIDGRLVAADAR